MTHEKSEMTINIYLKTYAAVVELVDTLALGASAERRGGSSPLRGTILTYSIICAIIKKIDE